MKASARTKPFRPRRERVPLAERLEAKLDRSGGPDACHPWIGARRKGTHPYGLIRVRQPNEPPRYRRTHRVAWELIHGPLVDGEDVLHKCDNPPCCNERHLFKGDQTLNMSDMTAKGRRAKPPIGLRGTKNGTSRKLKP